MNEKIETKIKALKFKGNDRVRITNHNNIFSKGYAESLSRKILFIDTVSFWKLLLGFINLRM